jgi:hypothetical protein
MLAYPLGESHIVRYAFVHGAADKPRSRERGGSARTRVLLALLVCALLWLAPRSAAAGEIYKCVDASGRVTYQSAPCKNGGAIDIAPGSFDPAAAQRLREEAAQWNARDDMRRALAARDDAAEMQRRQQADAAARIAEAGVQASADAQACSYCDGWNAVYTLPYAGWTQPAHPHPHPRPPPRPHPRPPQYHIVIH